MSNQSASEARLAQSFLEHIVKAKSQYDSTCRQLAARVLELEAALAQPAGVDSFNEGVDAAATWVAALPIKDAHLRAWDICQALKRETPRPAAPDEVQRRYEFFGKVYLCEAPFPQHVAQPCSYCHLETVEPPQGDGLRELIEAAKRLLHIVSMSGRYISEREALYAAIEKAKGEVARKETP